MADPVTLSVGAIAALAFTKFLESSAGEAAKRLTPALLDKIEALRQTIWTKLRGIPAVGEVGAIAEAGGPLTQQQVQLLVPHLEAAMEADPAFAEDVRQTAQQINQEINIGEILGKNIQNVYGGTATQINDASGQVFSGNITGGTFNFGTKS
jgi:hypothetical protein